MAHRRVATTARAGSARRGEGHEEKGEAGSWRYVTAGTACRRGIRPPRAGARTIRCGLTVTKAARPRRIDREGSTCPATGSSARSVRSRSAADGVKMVCPSPKGRRTLFGGDFCEGSHGARDLGYRSDTCKGISVCGGSRREGRTIRIVRADRWAGRGLTLLDGRIDDGGRRLREAGRPGPRPRSTSVARI